MAICVASAVWSSSAAGEFQPQGVAQGPHHRTWVTTREVARPDGGVDRVTSSFVELQGGVNKWDAATQAWIPASDQIELFQDGAIARHLNFSVIFSPSLADAGSIDVLLPDGEQRLRGHPIGIVYSENGNSVLVAEVQPCTAEIVAGNNVIYRDACTDYLIDIEYHVRKDSLAQWLVIHERLPHPSVFGMTEAAHVEVLTEWTLLPAYHKESAVIEAATATQRSLVHERIRFPSGMEFVTSKAFAFDAPEGAGQSVFTRLENFAEGRVCLVEAVPYRRIAGELAKLPERQAGIQKPKNVVASRSVLPVRGQASTKIQPIQMAKTKSPDANYVASIRRANAFVWDFELVQSVSLFRWQNGTTYYVSGPFTVQTNIFESCVVKYAPTNNSKLTITGPVTCLATNYSLIHLTHRDDHTIGEPIGTNILSGYAANTALYLDYSGSIDLSSLRIKHASTAIGINQGGVHSLRDVQILDCDTAVSGYNYSVKVLNGLMARVTTAFGASPSSTVNTALVQHVTVNQASVLSPGGSPSVNLFVTNSLLVAVTNVAAFSGAHNGTNSTPSAVFQTVGAGAHYLANNAYRGNGSVNIDAALLASLRRKTTWPPTLFPSNTVIGNTNLIIAPQIERDDGLPDLGWHYDPLDIVFGSAFFTNSSILITNGAAVGTYLVSSGTYGIALADNARLFSEGQPTNLNRIVRYNTVQEQANNNWTNRGPSIFSTPTSVVNAPQARFRFTGFSIPARDAEHFYGADGGVDLAVPFIDCQFEGGSTRPQVYVTNCLFQRVAVTLESGETGFDAAFRHNTFLGGTNYLSQFMPGTWTVKDNLFDGTRIYTNFTGLTHDYNAYTTNAERYLPVAAHDVTLTTSNVTYETGPLGRFYLPSNSALTNKGSQIATNVGLYHFTCTTNQVKETNSTADIGFHYVALSSTNTVFDTDAEGLPDYVEDADGDGIVDTVESSWLSPGYTNGLSDLQVWELSSNVQVNDPAQDTGSNTNTQFETTMVAFGNTVICAWVDSNLGVTGYGAADDNCNPWWYPPGDPTPRFIGWAVSKDGGLSFSDKGSPPVFSYVADGVTNILGDAGDPVLGRDTNLGTIYLLGNPERPSIYYPDGTNQSAKIYMPLWRSTNNAESFLSPVNVLPGFANIPVGTNSFTNNFLISTAQFPPIHSGTNTNAHTFDPVYPPIYSDTDTNYCGTFGGGYARHMGDYDTAVSDSEFVYYSWFDGRNSCTNSGVIRNQADIRSIRVSWPR